MNALARGRFFRCCYSNLSVKNKGVQVLFVGQLQFKSFRCISAV